MRLGRGRDWACEHDAVTAVLDAHAIVVSAGCCRSTRVMRSAAVLPAPRCCHFTSSRHRSSFSPIPSPLTPADVNFEELARSTEDFNGAMLKAVCVEAGMIALRRDAPIIKHEDFVEGISAVQMKKKTEVNYYS